MDQIGSRQTSKLLLALLFSGLATGVAWGQAPTPTAAPPAPAVSPAPASGQPPSPAVEPPIPPDKVVMKVGEQQFTRQQIDDLIAHLDPRTQQAIAVQGKKQLGDQYATLVTLSQRALARHLDQTPEFAQKMAFQKLILEAQSAGEEINKQTTVPPEEVEKYYAAHAADYDQIMVRQFVVRKKAVEASPTTPEPSKEKQLPSVHLGWVGTGEVTVRTRLERNKQVSGLTVKGVEADFKFAGTDAELSTVLSGLVAAGVKVLKFDETKPTPPAPPAPTGPGLTPEEAKARAAAIRKELIAGTDIKKVVEDFKSPGDVIIESDPPHSPRRHARRHGEGGIHAERWRSLANPLKSPARWSSFRLPRIIIST